MFSGSSSIVESDNPKIIAIAENVQRGDFQGRKMIAHQKNMTIHSNLSSLFLDFEANLPEKEKLFYASLNVNEQEIYRIIYNPEGATGVNFRAFSNSLLLVLKGSDPLISKVKINDFVIKSKPRSGIGKVSEEIPMIGLSPYDVSIPAEMKLTYNNKENAWILKNGPTIKLSLKLTPTLSFKDIKIIQKGNKLNVNYKLPFLFSALQNRLNNFDFNQISIFNYENNFPKFPACSKL